MILAVRNLVAEKDVVKKKQKHVERTAKKTAVRKKQKHAEKVVKKTAVRKNQNKKILKGVFNE